MASGQHTSSGKLAKPQSHPSHLQVWGIVGIVAQLALLAGVFIPVAWQGPRYSALLDTISDTEAVTAPHAWFPLACFVVGGLGTCAFAIFGLRPALAAAGKVAASAPWLLACSVLVLGSPVPRVPCRLADPGCSLHVQISTPGGLIEGILSGIAFLVLVVTPIPLGRRLALLPFWRRLVPVMKAARTVGLSVYLLLSLSTVVGIGQGLMERLLSTICVVWIAVLAWGLIVCARQGQAQAS
jgi:Protein of unknown function (DUF998)